MPHNPEAMEKAERAAAALSKTIDAQFKLSAEGTPLYPSFSFLYA